MANEKDSFWSTVDRRGSFACWPDMALVGSTNWRKRLTDAWEMATDKVVPKGHMVYRLCGTFGCLNPRHLGCASFDDARAAIALVREKGPQCRVESTPDRAAPMLTLAAPAKTPRTLPPGVCSYCGCSGGKGTATVCGASIACPVCSAPEWPALVEAYGAESA
jgi:hypothetical protein